MTTSRLSLPPFFLQSDLPSRFPGGQEDAEPGDAYIKNRYTEDKVGRSEKDRPQTHEPPVGQVEVFIFDEGVKLVKHSG